MVVEEVRGATVNRYFRSSRLSDLTAPSKAVSFRRVLLTSTNHFTRRERGRGNGGGKGRGIDRKRENPGGDGGRGDGRGDGG